VIFGETSPVIKNKGVSLILNNFALRLITLIQSANFPSYLFHLPFYVSPKCNNPASSKAGFIVSQIAFHQKPKNRLLSKHISI
jgi:hypothetical protein